MEEQKERKNWAGALAKVDRRLLWAGVFLLAVGIMAPASLTVANFGIYDALGAALDQWERIYVLLAAIKLVALNTLRALPHYLGVFFLAEAINESGEKRLMPVSFLVICTTIPTVYFVIENLYGIHYDLGVPALSMITMMLLFSKIRFDFVNLTKKVLMLVLLITSIQFLDVMPALRGLPIGRGESSLDIKFVSSFLHADPFLQGMASVCAVLFLFAAILVLILIHDENNIKRISEQKEQSERELMETQIRVMENRTYMELNHLVHDLKSPLTSMQALVGVVKLSCECQQRSRDVDYLEKIEENIERMSSMISEILYEDRLTTVTTRQIVTGLLSHISAAEYAEMVQVDNQVPEMWVEVNTIRFSRALVNLIENSFYAVDREQGKIWLRITRCDREDGPGVSFEVRDNGVGINREHLDRVWIKGFSTRGSHGLGLSFVEKVVTQSGGTITIDSVRDQGTQVRISLPAAEASEDTQCTIRPPRADHDKEEALMSEKMERVLAGISVQKETQCFGVILYPLSEESVSVRAPENMDRKRFERQYQVLRGYLCLALGGPLREDYPVPLAQLELPPEENGLAAAAVWLDRAFQTGEPHQAVMAVYNGFVALSGEHTETEDLARQYMGADAAQFLRLVRAAQWEEDDLGRSASPAPDPEIWRQADLELPRSALLAACRAQG